MFFLQDVKNDGAQLLCEFYFCPNLGKREPKIGYFAIFFEIVAIWYKNKTKWEFLLYLTFHCKPHFRQNSYLGFINENVLDQSDCTILWSVISLAEIEGSSWYFVCWWKSDFPTRGHYVLWWAWPGKPEIPKIKSLQYLCNILKRGEG